MLLLQLAPKARIASVTFLAPEGARALFPGAADGIALNHNTAEDIINVRPDLILDSTLGAPLGRIPIIGVSGRGDDEAASRAAGADAFLLKPVSPRALATALLEATRHAAAAT